MKRAPVEHGSLVVAAVVRFMSALACQCNNADGKQQEQHDERIIGL